MQFITSINSFLFEGVAKAVCNVIRVTCLMCVCSCSALSHNGYFSWAFHAQMRQFSFFDINIGLVRMKAKQNKTKWSLKKDQTTLNEPTISGRWWKKVKREQEKEIEKFVPRAVERQEQWKLLFKFVHSCEQNRVTIY